MKKANINLIAKNQAMRTIQKVSNPSTAKRKVNGRRPITRTTKAVQSLASKKMTNRAKPMPFKSPITKKRNWLKTISLYSEIFAFAVLRLAFDAMLIYEIAGYIQYKFV